MPTINGRACVVNGTPVDKVFSNGKQVYGRNLALGTATTFKMTGNNSVNQSWTIYFTSGVITKGTTVKVSFDIASTNATGTFAIGFVKGSWQTITIARLMAGTQHGSYTLVTNADYSDGIQLRLDNSTSIVTISNFIISESSKEIAWTPAPEDVM